MGQAGERPRAAITARTSQKGSATRRRPASECRRKPGRTPLRRASLFRQILQDQCDGSSTLLCLDQPEPEPQGRNELVLRQPRPRAGWKAVVGDGSSSSCAELLFRCKDGEESASVSPSGFALGLFRSQVRPPRKALETGPFCCVSGNGMAICKRPCKRDLGEFDGITTLANGTC
jgi:hypothetical protein